MGRKEATRTCAFAAEEVEEGCNPDRERAKDRLGRETGDVQYTEISPKRAFIFPGLRGSVWVQSGIFG